MMQTRNTATNVSLMVTKEPTWYHEDIWQYSDLGIDGKQADDYRTFSFKLIKQSWLKSIVKHYIYHEGINKSCHFVGAALQSLISFSNYLSTLPVTKKCHSVDDITRTVIIGYFAFLSNQAISVVTRQIRILNIARFLEVCCERGWVKYQGKLIYSEDVPRRPNKIPRFIPDKVIDQLNRTLDQMDPHIRRIVLVLQETGMRINELIKLPFDCLYQDREGDYFLKYFQSKLNKEHIIPISKELASTIKEQQNAVHTEWNQHPLLFPTPNYIKQINLKSRIKKTVNRGQSWPRKTLADYLNAFAKHHHIVGEEGHIWQFGFHSFRHTVATNMINHDVPQHIVQRYLGHESPAMTARYAHIFDQTLKKAFAKFKGNMVTVTGEMVNSREVAMKLAEGTKPEDIDALWLKKHIMAQALPNGTCALPAISNSCPHANACLTCVNFRTDHRYLSIHQQQLEKTKAIIQQAEENGWQRQLEMNLAIKSNLEKIITALEDAK